MIRRKTNKECYTVPTADGLYCVVAERIKNDINGNPRFEFEVFKAGQDITQVYVYRAGGHYTRMEEECNIIAKYHVNTVLGKEA